MLTSSMHASVWCGVVVPASREAALHLRAKIQTKMEARNVRDTPNIHRNINDKLSNM